MASAVYLHTQDISFDYPSPKIIQEWIESVINSEGGKLGSINFIVCTDEFLLELNKKYLNHDTLTDVITFPLSDTIDELEGEIYISLDRIKENAANLKIDTEEELKRVMVHGVLHLLGYKDKEKSAKLLMTKMEDKYLALL